MWQCNKTIEKIINFNNVTKGNIRKNNWNLPQIPGHPSIILIPGGSVSAKATSLFNLISQQPDINKIYLHAKDSFEAKIPFFK